MLINNYTNIERNTSTNLTPLNNKLFYNTKTLVGDTVSFTAMKKSEFKGCDAYVVEKYKAPIDKFNSNDDLQSWARGKCNNILNKDYQGRSDRVIKDRKKLLKEWFKYVTDRDTGYSKTQQLIILNGITKDLDPESATYPPVLNKGALADTITEIENNNTQINFSKIYKNKLQSLAISGDKTCGDYTGWIEIPSRNHDFWHFKDNVKKLQTLSHKNWCVKSYMAEPYLKKGDFHIYMENGEPKLALRFEERAKRGNMLVEIQGQKNNGDIPWQYIDQYYVHNNDLKERKSKFFFGLFKKNTPYSTTIRLTGQLAATCYIKDTINKIKKDYAEDIQNNNAEKLLPLFSIKVKKDTDGMLIISNYNQPNCHYTYSDLGINENEMFKQIKKIEGDAIFKDSKLKTLHNLERIEGEANFENSNITETGNLKYIGKDIRLTNSNLKQLKNVGIIKGNLKVDDCKLESLGKLRLVGGDAEFFKAPLKDLGQLERVCGEMVVGKQNNIISLGNIKRVKALGLVNSNVTDLGKLERIDGNADLYNTKFESFGNLKYIGGNVNFADRWAIERKPVTLELKDLGKLEYIGGYAHINNDFPLKEELNTITEGETYIVEDSFCTKRLYP